MNTRSSRGLGGAAAALCIALGCAAHAQCMLEAEAVLGGRPRGAALRGSTLFYGEGSTIVASDITDLTTPQRLATLPITGPIGHISAAGDWLFVRNEGNLTAHLLPGVWAVNISDPLSMHATWIEGNLYDSSTTDGRYFFVGSGSNVRIYDSSIQTNGLPSLLYSGPFDGTRLLSVREGLAIAWGSGQVRLMVFNPMLVPPLQLLSSAPVSNSSSAHFAEEHIVLPRTGTTALAVNIENPGAIYVETVMQYAPQNLLCVGDLAYSTAIGPSRLLVHDLTTIANPQLIGSVAVGTQTGPLHQLSPTLIAMTQDQAVAIVDVEQQDAPQLAATIPSPLPSPTHAADRGEYTYVLSSSVLYVMPRNYGESASPVAGIPIPAGPGVSSMVHAGEILAVRSGSNAYIYDLHDPALPQLVSTIGGLDSTRPLTLSGDVLLAVEGTLQELKIYSLEDPAHPVVLATIPNVPFPPSAWVVHDEKVYCWSGTGLWIADYSDRSDVRMRLVDVEQRSYAAGAACGNHAVLLEQYVYGGRIHVFELHEEGAVEKSSVVFFYEVNTSFLSYDAGVVCTGVLAGQERVLFYLDLLNPAAPSVRMLRGMFNQSRAHLSRGEGRILAAGGMGGLWAFRENTPRVTRQPVGVACMDQQVELHTQAEYDGGPVTYYWRKNGSVLPGENSPTLLFTSFTKSDEGVYDCVIDGGCIPVLTNPVRLYLCPADANCDGALDDLDIAAYFARFEAGDAAADINHDDAIDDLDLRDFFAALETGCP